MYRRHCNRQQEKPNPAESVNKTIEDINDTHPCNDDMTVRLVADDVFQVLLRSSETTPIQ